MHIRDARKLDIQRFPLHDIQPFIDQVSCTFVACGNIITAANSGECFKPLRGKVDCAVDGILYTFREYEYDGGVS